MQRGCRVCAVMGAMAAAVAAVFGADDGRMSFDALVSRAVFDDASGRIVGFIMVVR